MVPDFSNPADAARAWADQYEAAQRAIAEKSQAEAEKQQAFRLILGDRYSEEVAVITDADVTTDVAITTLLSDFIKKGG